MALCCFMGLMGAGKSYVAVNKWLLESLRDSGRHVYTNLPCDGDERERLLIHASRNLAKREEMRSRLHFLPHLPGEVVCRIETYRDGDRWAVRRLDGPENLDKEGRDKGRDLLLEFWYFVEANSVIYLDEVGDLYNTEKRKERPDFLISFINHHRHYKIDLFFFLQDVADIDPQVRRKIQFCYVVTNSTKCNIADWWVLRGFRWPVQFFRVRMILGSKLRKGDPYMVSERDPDETYAIWPSSRGFRNYRSFSAASTLPGMKLPSEKDLSTDFDPRLWPKVLNWLGQSSGVLAMAGGLAVALWLGVRGVYAMAGLNSGAILPDRPHAATNEQQTASVPSTPVRAPGLVGESSEPGDRERVLLVTPGRVKTTKAVYEAGSFLGSNRVHRVFLDGFEFGDGRRVSYRSAF